MSEKAKLSLSLLTSSKVKYVYGKSNEMISDYENEKKKKKNEKCFFFIHT